MADDDNALNAHGHVLWFDDLGSGNEDFNFLSNFYEDEPITLPDVTWERLFVACRTTDAVIGRAGSVLFATGEHAFAALKFWGTDWTHFKDIVDAKGPNAAKALGRSRKHPLREDWETVKLDVMAAVLRAKFTMDRPEGQRLLDTGDRMLTEGTWWHDDVWGVDLHGQGIPGRNWLGTLLMARRAELRAHAAYPGDLFVKHFATDTLYHNAAFSAP